MYFVHTSSRKKNQIMPEYGTFSFLTAPRPQASPVFTPQQRTTDNIMEIFIINYNNIIVSVTQATHYDDRGGGGS